MLNSYESYTEGSLQYKWLVNDLAAANIRRQEAPWIIVNFHSPMYSSSSGHGGGDKAFQEAIEALLEKYHVDLCFTGHDHGYERSYPIYNYIIKSNEKNYYNNPKSPIHVLVGIAGATQDPWLEQKPNWSIHRESTSGFVRLQAFQNNSLHFELIRFTNLTNQIREEVWIVKSSIETRYPRAVIAGSVVVLIPFVLFYTIRKRFFKFTTRLY